MQVCGPESFTPDHKPLMGETPELPGFFVGCGLNSAGIMYRPHFYTKYLHHVSKKYRNDCDLPYILARNISF